MTNPTPEQDAAIERLSAANKELRRAKSSIRRRVDAAVRQAVEEAMRTELADLEREHDLLAYQAREAGAPVSRIAHDGMHTTYRTAAYEAIARGEQFAPTAIKHREFAWTDAGHLQVTPVAEALRPLLSLIDMDPEVFAANEVLHSAVFDISQGGLMPLTPSFDETFGRHPVVALATDPTYRAQILEWVEDQPAVDAPALAA